MKHKKLPHYIGSALLGLLLACSLGVNTVPAQDTTNTIMLTDFDNSPNWTWGYGYDYSWGGTAPPSPNWAYIPLYTNGVEVYYGFWFTNAPYEPLVTGGGQYGIGFGGPEFTAAAFDPTAMSTNLEDYIFSFDARAEGLAPGQATGNAQMQFQWGPGNFFQCNFNVSIPSNWTHYAWLVSNADAYDKGTISNWVFMIQNWLVTGAQWNVDMNRPDRQFGFDADNAVFIDNVRLDMITRATPPIVLPAALDGTILEWNMDDKPLGGYLGWRPLVCELLPAELHLLDQHGDDGRLWRGRQQWLLAADGQFGPGPAEHPGLGWRPEWLQRAGELQLVHRQCPETLCV